MLEVHSVSVLLLNKSWGGGGMGKGTENPTLISKSALFSFFRFISQ